MNTKLICTGLLGLALWMSPAVQAQAPAAPAAAATAAAETNVIGAALAKLPHVNGIAPNTNARYYFFVSSASWCGPCRAIMPQVVKQYEAIKATGDVEVVLVCFDRTWEQAKAYADHYKMPFCMVMRQDVVEQHVKGFPDVHGIPHAALISADGRLLGQGHGSLMLHWQDAIRVSEEAMKLEEQKKAAAEAAEKTVMHYLDQPALGQMDDAGDVAADDDEDEPKATKKKSKKKDKKKDKKDKKKGKYASEIGKDIAGLKFLNKNKPNPKAKYYIYLSSASWCGPCRALHPQIVAKYKDMKKDKVELILVSNDHDETSGKAYADGYPCPAIMDAQSSKLPGFSPAQGIPQAIIVNGKGEVLQKGHGSIALQYENIIKNDPSASENDTAADDEEDVEADDAADDEDEDAKPKKKDKKKKKSSKKKK